MSVIEASSVGVRTMVDGTLRLTVDIEPRHAQAAFALFGAPGVPMALAALKVGQPEPVPEMFKAPTPKGGTGPICLWLAMRCRDPAFRAWLTDFGDFNAPLTEETCAQVVRDWCQVGSRSEIDGNTKAEALFERHIRKPWLAHTKQATTA
jgi:hypothetical protein